MGVALLLAGLYSAVRTWDFVERAVAAEAVVVYRTRYTLGVRRELEDGRTELISVRKPWLSFPWAYLPSDTVEILYDPALAADPVLPFTEPFSPIRARLASRLRLWLGTVGLLAGGLACLILYALSALLPGRFRADVRIQTRR